MAVSRYLGPGMMNPLVLANLWRLRTVPCSSLVTVISGFLAANFELNLASRWMKYPDPPSLRCRFFPHKTAQRTGIASSQTPSDVSMNIRSISGSREWSLIAPIPVPVHRKHEFVGQSYLLDGLRHAEYFLAWIRTLHLFHGLAAPALISLSTFASRSIGKYTRTRVRTPPSALPCVQVPLFLATVPLFPSGQTRPR
ncbi:hypothetical protein B0H11DRAFT_659791 [Mycena galericulata]|nr:hypothetical protein B0H11DRAFT_659791 [Mycena galericulata]